MILVMGVPIQVTDDIHVSMHASTEHDVVHDNIPVMYDDEPRNLREVLKHKESADILHAGALEITANS